MALPRLAGRQRTAASARHPAACSPRRSTLVSPPGPHWPYGTVPPPGGPAARAAGLGRGLHDPARLGQQVSPARRRARASQPPRRPPHPRSARAASRDVRPRPRSGQLADACPSRVRVSSSLQGGAGPAREGDRPTQVRRRGADNRYAAQRVIQGRAGIVWVAVWPGGKPDGDPGPAAAGTDSGVVPGPAARVPRPLTPRPGQPAGVTHTTVAQPRTDLQGISHAERNWSDEGWRLAVAVGVPGSPQVQPD